LIELTEGSQRGRRGREDDPMSAGRGRKKVGELGFNIK